EPRRLARLEFHQHVHIAVGAKVAAQYRSEKRQSADAIAAAQLSQACWIGAYARRFGCGSDRHHLLVTPYCICPPILANRRKSSQRVLLLLLCIYSRFFATIRG